jgi:hypothetical protein
MGKLNRLVSSLAEGWRLAPESDRNARAGTACPKRTDLERRSLKTDLFGRMDMFFVLGLLV